MAETMIKARWGFDRDAASGCSDILEEYPSLTTADIYACLDYAASLAEEKITSLEMLENAS